MEQTYLPGETKNIITPQVNQYLNGLYQAQNSFLGELRKESEERHIPIILPDAEGLILQLLGLKQPVRILEIGTAVGYSALVFATASSKVLVTSLEILPEMQEEAVRNIRKAGLEKRIQVLLGDAKETLPTLKGFFDMIFIDAAKGQYQAYFDLCLPYMKSGTVVISDNVLFKGMVASDEFLSARRKKTMIQRLRNYLDFLTQTEGVATAVLPVGDGLAVSTITDIDKLRGKNEKN